MRSFVRSVGLLVLLVPIGGCAGGRGNEDGGSPLDGDQGVDADADTDADGDTEGDTDGDTDTDTDTGADGDADMDADADADADADMDADAGGDGGPTPDGGRDGDVDGGDAGGPCDVDGASSTATVSTTEQLEDAIAAAAIASGPTVVWLEAGTYSCVRIESRAYDRDAPLVIRASPEATGAVIFDPGGCYFNTLISGSSYVALDGVTVSGGGGGVWVEESDHVILRDLHVSGQGQEGIHVRKSSSYVDILDSRIHDTGHTNPQWGECIYVGTGSGDDFPDHTDHVWIEGNEIFECGNGEGINVKPEVFHATVRGNDIHDIQPGTPGQYNQSALAVEGSARSGGDYLPTEPREVWVEDNDVANVTYGEFASGIMVGGTGVYVVGNRVSSYEERGIYVNGWGDLGLPVYLFGNEVDASGEMDYYLASDVDVRESDPGPNPHSPQSWYCR